MKVLVGDIQFCDAREIDGPKAVIYSATEIDVEADFEVETLLETYDAYLIPGSYSGKIEDLR